MDRRIKGSTWIGSSDQPEFTDTTVSASTSYTYQLYALDYFNNWSSAVSVNVTTPGTSAVDPRRVGSRPTGAYWGASPEQIDLLSGNLNFSIPLLSAQGRSGWSVPFDLSYNSQTWRKDSSGGIWELGEDVGYGYGWRLMAGSLTAFYSSWLGVDHYQFVDASGAEYRLDQNSSGVWSSLESIYVWFDSNANVLHFRDGSFWVMGCISGGTEADAGTMYPSVMEDSNGNQVLVRYYAGAGLGWSNSSARIQEIEDVRAVYGSGDYKTYTFTFNTVNGGPHLQEIDNTIGTSEGYTFSIASLNLHDPFSSTTFPETTALNQVTTSGIGTHYDFTYDSSGEMTEVVLPYKGYLKWTYGNVTYSSGFEQREAQTRILSKDGTSGSEKTYSFFHESSPSSVPVHQCTILDDPGLVGEKYWGFNTSGTYETLVNEYQGRQVSGTVTHSGCSSESPSPTILTESDFTWSQSSGQSYISSTLVTANSVQSKTTQTVDGYGNVTQVAKYNYGSLTSAYRTFNYSYLSSSSYTARYIYNRLTSSTVTDGAGTNTTLSTITYDYGSLSSLSPTPREWDSGMASVTYRGNPSTISDPSNYTTVSRNVTGAATGVTVNGVTTSVSTSTTTNYAAPEQLTVGSLYTTNTYSSFLGLTNETDQNSNGIALGYDSYARPTSSTSPFGAAAGTAYYDTAAPPYVLTGTSASSRWTKTILDGLGRTLEVNAGDSGGTQSVAESVYDSCGCSPLGKLVQQAVPHAYGATPVHYTTYTYDGIGRTLSIQAPDGASTTYYSYTGNVIKVIDPASSVKSFTMDVMGNLVQVTEDPLGLDYVTTYTYDGLNHLTGVSMTRGSTTQTRSFAYNGNYLTSATNPENGTVNYTYNSYNKVATRIDANNQKVAYTYDSYARLTEVQRYPVSTGSEDLCQRETYYYDSNPFDGGSYSYYTAGRLAAVQYYGGITSFGCGSMDTNHTTFQEWYNYGIPGAPVGKKLRVTRAVGLYGPPYSQSMNVDLTGTFSYDTEGKMTSESYPTDNAGATASLGMSYDTMGRLYTLTDQLASLNIIASASYGPANELTGLTAGSYSGNWGSESRGYNAMKQLTSLSSNGVSLTYSYSSSANNGKITSQYDTVSGETVAYAYDALNRLHTAAATSGGSWGQTYAYDGFGNLTAITGTAAASYSYNSSTNQGSCSDYNGNSNVASCAGLYYGYTYDIENRIVITPSGGPGGTMFYSYAPGNKRVWRGNGGATDEVTFWSPSGQKLGTYAITATAQTYSGGMLSGPYFYATQTGTNYYFGGKLIKNAGGWVYSDRLGSIGKFYPYGQERPSATTNGTEKFTGYFRDSETGLDYADQRYESPGLGRFLTADRLGGGPTEPGSWNLYAYTRGDPINRTDANGRCDSDFCVTVTNTPDDNTSDEDSDVAFGPLPTQNFFAGGVNPNKIQTEIRNAVKTALKALKNPSCAALFGLTPGSPDPATLLQDLFADLSQVRIGNIVPPQGSSSKIVRERKSIRFTTRGCLVRLYSSIRRGICRASD